MVDPGRRPWRWVSTSGPGGNGATECASSAVVGSTPTARSWTTADSAPVHTRPVTITPPCAARAAVISGRYLSLRGSTRDRRRAGRQTDADRDRRRDRQAHLDGVAGNPRPQHRRAVSALPGRHRPPRRSGPTEAVQTGAPTRTCARRWKTGYHGGCRPKQISHRLRQGLPRRREHAGEPRDDLPGAVLPGPRRTQTRSGPSTADRADPPQTASGARPAQPPVRRPDDHDQRPARRGRGPCRARALGGRPDHGRGEQSAIATLVERATRYTMLVHLPDGHDAEAVRDGLIATIATLPAHLRGSLTWDQGAEMARHKQFTHGHRHAGLLLRPGSPWQRGTNENTNGLLRQYFPKGTDLSVLRPRGPRTRRPATQRPPTQNARLGHPSRALAPPGTGPSCVCRSAPRPAPPYGVLRGSGGQAEPVHPAGVLVGEPGEHPAQLGQVGARPVAGRRRAATRARPARPRPAAPARAPRRRAGAPTGRAGRRSAGRRRWPHARP